MTGFLAWHCVLVDGDVGQLQHSLHSASINTLGPQIHQQQVVIGASRDQLVLQLVEPVSHGAAVAHDLLLVGLELGSLGLLQGTGQA